MDELVPVCRPHLWGDELAEVERVLDAGWLSASTPVVEEFEHAFARRTGVTHAVAVMNGTCALELALDVLAIGPGDEVIVPAFCMFSPVLAVLRRGAIPIPVDADRTWNLDVEQTRAAITSRTRAILVVHTYGHPARCEELVGLAREAGVLLVEDAAEALGATVGDRHVGTFGALGCFSLYANKVITTGEGGVVVTDSDHLAQALRWKRNLCFGSDDETRFTHEALGYNYRMSALQAALGVAQIRHLDAAVESRIANARSYDAELAAIPGIALPPRSSWCGNVFWVYGITIESQKFGKPRAAIQRALREAGIETRRFFTPLHRQPVLRGTAGNFPVADRLWRDGFYLPSFVGMPASVAGRVATILTREARS